MRKHRRTLALTAATWLLLMLAPQLHSGPTTEQRQEVQKLINQGNKWKDLIQNERQEAIKCRERHRVTGDPADEDMYLEHVCTRMAYEESLKANRDSVIDLVDEIFECGIPPGTDIQYDAFCGSTNDGVVLGFCSARCPIRICEPAFKSPDDVALTKIHEGKHARQKLEGVWGPSDMAKECTAKYHKIEAEAVNAELTAALNGVISLEDTARAARAEMKKDHVTAAWLDSLLKTELDLPVIDFSEPDSSHKRRVTVTNAGDEASGVEGHFEDDFGWVILPSEFAFFLESEQETTFDFFVLVPSDAEPGTANEIMAYVHAVPPARGAFAPLTQDTLPAAFMFIQVITRVEVLSGPDVEGSPGSDQPFFFTIRNRGGVRDSFDVFATSVLGWPLDPAAWQVTLDPQDEIEVNGSVEIGGGEPAETDLILCQAVSRSDPAQTDSSWLSAVVLPAAGIKDRPETNVFALMQNVPNPFSGSTSIRFSLASRGLVDLRVYDVRGREVKKLFTHADGPFDPGIHTVAWKGEGDTAQKVASGVYFYRLRAGGRVATRKLVLLR